MDLQDMLHSLYPRITGSLQSDHMSHHMLYAEFCSLDPTILNDLPRDADLTCMRQHLKNLKALGRTMSRWKKLLDGVPSVRSSLEIMHEGRATDAGNFD